MRIQDLVFIGIKGSVVALDRASGIQVWATRLKGMDFVNVVLDSEDLLASCYGEVFRLDPLTGRKLWHNPLKGFGMGLATIATCQNSAGGNAQIMVQKRRRDQQAAASAAAASAASV